MEKGVTIGFVVMAAVAVLVGLALYSGNFQDNIGTLTQTAQSGNVTITMPEDGVTLELTSCQQKAVTYIVTNATGGETVPASNYTIDQAIQSDGYLGAQITGVAGEYNSSAVNVSCTYERDGYIDNAGSRGIVGLIAIFMAFLIALAAMPNVREWFTSFGK